MKFTSLGLPYYDENLGLYACEYTVDYGMESGGSGIIYAHTLKDLQEKKRQFIIKNLELSKEELANWPSLNK